MKQTRLWIRANVSDVWIEKCRSGVYPQVGDEKDAEELVDKILYVNPVDGMAVSPVSITVDIAGYQHNGKPLGDHYPLIATFTVDEANTTGINTPSLSEDSQSFDLQGRQIVNRPSQRGIYINDGRKVVIK